MSRRVFQCRVDVKTPPVIEKIAQDFGCLRAAGQGQIAGAVGVMLDKIAQGELVVSRA